MASAEEESVLSVEGTLGKPVTGKWAAVSVTVHEEVSTVRVPSVVQTLLSGLGIIAALVPLGLEVTASRVKALPLLVSPPRDDITERALGGDVVSVVSTLDRASDLGLPKGEEPVFPLVTLMRLIVAEPSDLSEVQGPVGVIGALRVVTAVSAFAEEALSIRSLPDVRSDHGLVDE